MRPPGGVGDEGDRRVIEQSLSGGRGNEGDINRSWVVVEGRTKTTNNEDMVERFSSTCNSNTLGHHPSIS